MSTVAQCWLILGVALALSVAATVVFFLDWRLWRKMERLEAMADSPTGRKGERFLTVALADGRTAHVFRDGTSVVVAPPRDDGTPRIP